MLKTILESENAGNYNFVRVKLDGRLVGFNIFDKSTGNGIYLRDIRPFQNIKVNPVVEETIHHDPDDRLYNVVFNKYNKKQGSPHCLKLMCDTDLLGGPTPYTTITTFTQNPDRPNVAIGLKRSYSFVSSRPPARTF